jgi:nitrite reductase (NADH) large subunit
MTGGLKMRYVIIGNSAAGIKCAETIREKDPIGTIRIITDEVYHAYSRCLLPDYLAAEQDEDSLRIREIDFYEKNNIIVEFGVKAEEIKPESKEVFLGNGRVVGYDKLLIATGSRSLMPPIPGLNGENIFGLRTLQDAKRILKALPGTRRAVVIGGGFVGLEAAYALYSKGIEVTVVERLPQILPNQFDQKAAQILSRDMQQEGIRIITGNGVKEVLNPTLWQKLFGKKGKGVLLENGETLKCELIIVTAGAQPNIEVAQGAGVAVERGIVVDDYMESTVKDIFAAGDVVETADAVTGKSQLSPIWPNAIVQGRIAGLNMAGIPTPYTQQIGMQNAVEFREVPAIAAGITEPEANDEVIIVERLNRNKYKKFIIRDGKLVGMILVGDIRQAGVYNALIKNKIDVSKTKDYLAKEDFNFGYFLASGVYS